MSCARTNASAWAGSLSRMVMPMNWALSLVSWLAACSAGASSRHGGHQDPQMLSTITLPA